MPSRFNRNYERLRKRKACSEAENVALMEANREIRQDLARMDSIVEYVLAIDELPAQVFEKLSEVSDLLVAMKTKLR